MNYLVTGVNSGLGKYLFENLPDANGLNRNNFDLIKNEDYDVIIHCAFNKIQDIQNYYNYLEDNIFLTQKLLNLKYKKFIYISSIDVYNNTSNTYSLFKHFAESIVENYPNVIILRCSMIIGKETRPNHITKLRDNIASLSLSKDSTFNYILNSDILEFVEKYSLKCSEKIIDFVSNESIKLEDVKNILQSDTKLGDYIYSSNYKYLNPIYNSYKEFNNSSLKNLKKYING